MFSSTRVAEAGVDALPAHEPGGEVLLGFGQIAAVIEPPQFLQAVVVGLSRHMVESIAQEVHIAALPGGLREDLHETAPQSLVIVGHHELHAVQTAVPKGNKEVPPAGLALPAGEFYAQDLPVSLLVDADGDQDGLAADDATLPHPFVAGIQDEIGIGLV
jgi:hypothetical protein